MEESWDEELFVLEQVKIDESNFKNASDRLKSDPKFVLELLNQAPDAIDFVDDELKNDPKFCRKLATKLDVELYNNKKYVKLKESAESQIVDEFEKLINFDGDIKILETTIGGEKDLTLFHDLYWTFIDKGLIENTDFFFSQSPYSKDKDVRYGTSMIFKTNGKLLGIVNMEDKPERYMLLTDNADDFQYVVKDMDELKKFEEKGNELDFNKLKSTKEEKAINKEQKIEDNRNQEDMTVEELEEILKEKIYSNEEKTKELNELRRKELIARIKEAQEEGKKLDEKIKEAKARSMEER